jgi:hypothetical protein
VRKLVLLACVGLAGAGVAVLPSLGSAQGTTASFTAVDSGQPILELHYWYATGTTSGSVAIVPGGTVSFSYPTGDSTRNVVFTGPQPTSCTQTSAPSGYTVGPAPPLPRAPQPAGWSGSCRFDTPGVYTFQDAFVADAVTGTITVAAPSTTPTSTSTPTTTPRPTSTTFVEPAIPAASSSLRAPTPQHGTAVRGQIHLTTSDSRIVADLLSPGHPAILRGRTTLYRQSHGTRHFTVHLYKSAIKALRLRGRLTLTLRVQVLGGGLGPTTLSRHVTLTR